MFVPRRLDKFLCDATCLSVVEVRAAIAAGRVRISSPQHSACELNPAALVFGADHVQLDAQRVQTRAREHCAVFNKPRSVTVSARDPQGKRDLKHWLAEMPKGIFPVGRLDRETTGLLLFTTDGDLSNAVLQPDHHTDKVYWLWLNECVKENDPKLAAWRTGIQVGAQLYCAEQVEVRRRTLHFTELHVTLRQGKNRQLRRMCRASDLRLLHLHRLRVGPLSLGELEPGQWRLLTDAESCALWAATGGRARVLRRKIAALQALAWQLRERGQPQLRLEAWLSRETAQGLAQP